MKTIQFKTIKKIKKIAVLSGVMVASISFSHCQNEDSSDKSGITASQKSVTFKAKVGSADFSCSTATYANMGSTGTDTIKPRDFRFYIHDVKLEGSDGKEYAFSLDQDGTWQYKNVVLLDFEDGSGNCANTSSPTTGTNNKVKGKVSIPSGVSIKKVTFNMGVPLDLNHNNRASAPAPLNMSALYWAWSGGYKFARLDFDSQNFDGNPDTATKTFNVHLGSTRCNSTGTTPSTSCQDPNRPKVTLDFIDGQTVIADLKKLVEDTDLTKTNTAAAGCMSFNNDPECKAILNNFGIDFTYTGSASSNRGLADGSSTPVQYPSSVQKFFRVE